MQLSPRRSGSLAAPILALVVSAVGCASGSDGLDAGAGIDAARGDGGSGAADTGPDAGPPGGACTPETAEAVCGALPCVDGFCCDQACEGDCRGCDVAGSEGECTMRLEGEDPEGDCVAEPGATCGRTGTCDGAGACALHSETQTCDDGESCTTEDSCDGAGVCRGAAPPACAPGAGNECCVGTCTTGSGCSTDAGACGDLCTSHVLNVARSCQGCGGAGAAGSCGGGAQHLCDENDHDLCRELDCGGVRFFCSNEGGSWSWRTAPRCDDGEVCTHGDSCVAGTCRGTSLTCTSDTCMTRVCDGTDACAETPNVGSPCEDGDLCTYNDACDASGQCGAGTSITCADEPCIDRECNGGFTCDEMILTASSCDDGDPCTYGSTCTASAQCEGGTTIECDSMDTLCRDFFCDNAATCGSVAQNLGQSCDDGDPITEDDMCQADGSCMGDAGCPPPTLACSDGSQDRRGCANARVIGRPTAAGGLLVRDNTCSASDRFDDSSGCWDANADHAYRLYMREGESVYLRYDPRDPCSFDEVIWRGTLKIFENSGCDDMTCGTKVFCEDRELNIETTYVAPRDGWIVIVLDGSSAFDDEGTYDFHVNLTCSEPSCGC